MSSDQSPDRATGESTAFRAQETNRAAVAPALSQKPRFNPAWISAWILTPPAVVNGQIRRGAIILNYVDDVVGLVPEIRRYFIIVERRGWHGLNRGQAADIKLVEDLTTIDETRQRFPEAILLELGPADFVDHEAFKPIDVTPDFDVIQISCWSPRKRIELLIQAAALLPDRRFVHLGHFERNGSENERAYQVRCRQLAAEIAPNVTFPFGGVTSNDEIPMEKTAMNHWLNRARIGVLTTLPEGINRFKMECLSAGRPMLVSSDAGPTTQKHITAESGALFPATADKLAENIQAVLQTRERYSPRQYLLRHTGRAIATAKLRAALGEICGRRGEVYRFADISWDGRNESLCWGDDGLREIRRAIRAAGAAET